MRNQKKILIVIVIIFLLILTGIFIAYRQFSQQGGIGFQNGRSADKDLILFSGGQFGVNGEIAEQEQGETGAPPRLRQISQAPTAGGVIFPDKTVDKERVLIRFVERATGHIFETSTNSLVKERISNTTIPRIQRAVWEKNGASVILQYLNENEIIKSFYGNLSGEKQNIDGWFLDNSIIDIAVDGTEKIFYLERNGNEVEGILSNNDGTNAQGVFLSSILDWSVWKGDSVILLSTKPARNTLGFLFRLNINSGTLSKILSENGLITLPSPDFSYILLSTSVTGDTRLFVYNVSEEEIVVVPFRTLADKCVWSSDSKTVYCASPFEVPDAVYPDDWYQGKVFFSDDIWSLDVKTNIEQLVFDDREYGESFDVIDLLVDEDNTTLLFTNKKDLTLWSYSLQPKEAE